MTALVALFTATVDPSLEVRQQAEKQLKEAGTQGGFGPLLLELLSQQISAGVLQAAAVFFKNLMERSWDERGVTPLPETDRAFIRDKIVVAVAHARDGVVRAQLLTAMRRMLRSGASEEGWPLWSQQVLELLGAGDADALHAGLLVVLELLKHDTASGESATESHLASLMPRLLLIGQGVAQALMAPSTSTPAAHAVMKAVMKAFFVAIRYKFSPHLLGDNATFMAWCTLLTQTLQMPIPSAELTPQSGTDTTDLERLPFWKMKKWALRSQNRITTRYGSRKEAKSCGPEVKAFARRYGKSLAGPMLVANLTVIEGAITGRSPLTDRVTRLLTEYLGGCAREKSTWRLLRPHFPSLLEHFLFPRLCFTEEDETRWEDDPQEFLKTIFFSFDDFDSTVSACVGLISDIVRARGKDTFHSVLRFVNGVLEMAGGASTGTLATQRQKDGALFLIGSLARLMLKDKTVCSAMEPFLTAHVLSELGSPQRFLRLRACWCIEQFDDLVWTQQDGAMAMLRGVLRCLEDKELPVRAQACVTVGALLEQDICQPHILPALGKIVQVTLDLTKEVELDALSHVMDRLVAMYPEELRPYAAELARQLADAFLRLLESSLVQEGEEGEGSAVRTDGAPVKYYFADTDKMMAAVGLLETIDTIVVQMCGAPEAAVAVEQVLVPLIMAVLQRQLTDILGETASIVETLTYHRKAISSEMMLVFGEMLRLLRSQPEVLIDMASSLENFVSYAPEALLQHPDYLNALVGVIDEALVVSLDGYDSETDRMCGIDLIESLMLYCRGRIDPLIPHFLDLAGRQLTECAVSAGQDPYSELSVSSIVRYLEVVLNALYYNASMTLAHVERGGWLGVFLSLWSTHMKEFVRVHDKRLVMGALAAIFHVAPESLPRVVSDALPALLAVFIDTVQEYPKALEARATLKREAEEDDGTEEEYADYADPEDYGELEDGGDSDQSDNEADAVRHDAASHEDIGEEEEADEDDDEYDDEWEDSDQLQEDIYFECPLDTVDFANLVRSTLTDCAQTRPQMWAAMTAALTPEHAAFIQSI